MTPDIGHKKSYAVQQCDCFIFRLSVQFAECNKKKRSKMKNPNDETHIFYFYEIKMISGGIG